MQVGLLWFDNTSRDLAEKVRRAADRYQAKHGCEPNVCYVHPSALDGKGQEIEIDPVRVFSLPSILEHHFWIGVEKGGGGNGRDPSTSTLRRIENEARERPTTQQLVLDILNEQE